MKGIVYEISSLASITASLFFFYLSTRFLTEKDYLAATLALFIGFTVVKGGVELAKLGVISRRGE